MSCVELQTRLIDARDYRQTLIERALIIPRLTVVCITTAIPGINKHPLGAKSLFHWAVAKASENINVWEWQTPIIRDTLGWFVVLATNDPISRVKQVCVGIEEMKPAARLMDLDVYHSNGEQLSRRDLGLPVRKCLLCEERAAHCIINKRHNFRQLSDHANQLLRTI